MANFNISKFLVKDIVFGNGRDSFLCYALLGVQIFFKGIMSRGVLSGGGGYCLHGYFSEWRDIVQGILSGGYCPGRGGGGGRYRLGGYCPNTK